MISKFFLNQNGNNLKLIGLINHFPSLIRAKHGKSGKWSRSTNFFLNNSASRPLKIKGPSGSGSGGFGNFNDGYDSGNKPRASSELVFFSTDKSYASYPMNHQNQNPRDSMKDALKAMMKPVEVNKKKIKMIIYHIFRLKNIWINML